MSCLTPVGLRRIGSGHRHNPKIRKAERPDISRSASKFSSLWNSRADCLTGQVAARRRDGHGILAQQCADHLIRALGPQFRRHGQQPRCPPVNFGRRVQRSVDALDQRKADYSRVRRLTGANLATSADRAEASRHDPATSPSSEKRGDHIEVGGDWHARIHARQHKYGCGLS
jgi:hypothetical protein